MEKFKLYNNDIEVARFAYDNGTITTFVPLLPELLPMQIRDATADGFALWLRSRSIDMNTMQHRQLMYELIGTRDTIAVALSTHMFSLSDTFTCFKENEYVARRALCTPDDQNTVSDYILVSSDISLRNMKVATPNASTDGSFTKTWRYDKGDWWLYKLQPSSASKTEYEISHVLAAIGWDTAEYEYQGSYRKRIRTRCFVQENEFFEPYESLRFMFSNRSDEDDVITANISSLGPDYALAWQRILLTDAVFMNPDRHMRNFGVIRSSVTGEILRLAPNFDNNLAYKALPNDRHYSDAMFRQYAKTTDYPYLDDLQKLITECRKHPYLNDVVTTISPYLQ